MIRINICCLVIAVMLAGNQSATAQDQSLMDLLQKMPTGANAVMVADLAKNNPLSPLSDPFNGALKRPNSKANS